MKNFRHDITAVFKTVLLTLALVIFMTSPAHSFVSAFPIGHDEPLMANTGVGGMGSPAGTIYNPALLAGVQESSLSASGSSFILIRIGSMTGDAQTSSLTSNPHTVINVWKLENGAAALSILSPQSNELDFHVGSSALSLPTDTKLQIEQFTILRTTLLGGSYGRKVGEDLSLGGSIFYGYATNDTFFWNAVNDDNEFGVTASKAKSTSQYLMAVLGAAWQKGATTYGIRLEPPSIVMNSSISGQQVVQAFGTTDGGTPYQVQRIANASSSKPAIRQWGIAAGLNSELTSKFQLRADVNLEEQARTLDETAPDTSSLSTSIGGRYFFSEVWSAMAGARVGWDDLINKVPDIEPKDVDVALTIGASRRHANFESNIGLLTLRMIKLEDPKTPAVAVFNLSQVEFWGVLFSGMYKF